MAANDIPASRADWIKGHQKQYLESGGKEGHIWNGVPTLLLTTTGKKSGKETTTPLIYGKAGESLVIVASKGGAPDHPMWYTNLAANSRVTVQVGEETFSGTARTAGADEKPALWKTMTAIWPAYDEYQTKTDREIPVVVIDRK
jgi:deazaflavin-dependent oxidoreductase (nitroreductase family)